MPPQADLYQLDAAKAERVAADADDYIHGGDRVIDVFGNMIERFMRACVASSFAPRSIKGFWIFMGVFLIKRRFMHSFQPSIRTQYGNKLAALPLIPV